MGIDIGGMEKDFIGRQAAWWEGASRAHDVTRLGQCIIFCLLNDRVRVWVTFIASIRRTNNWIGRDVEGS